MKKVSVKGKLSLNKETIAKLSNEMIQNVNGGDTNTNGCTGTCTTGCPTGGTTSKVSRCCIPPCW